MLNKLNGIQLAIITSFISGVSIFVNKFAVDAIKPPLYFTSLKNLAVGILIVSILIATKKWRLISKLTPKELKVLLLVGLIGGAIPFYLFFTGLSKIPAINGALIHKTLVVWVVLLAIPLLKEKISKMQMLGVILLFLSNYVVGGFKGFQFSQGELFVLIATMFWAVENVLAKKVLPTVDPDIVAAFRMGIGSIILVATTVATVPNLLTKSLALSGTQMFWVALTVAALLGYVMTWYRALKLAPAISVTAVMVSSTLVTNALSAIFITHAWNGVMAIQALLIAAGVTLIWKAAPAATSNTAAKVA